MKEEKKVERNERLNNGNTNLRKEVTSLEPKTKKSFLFFFIFYFLFYLFYNSFFYFFFILIYISSFHFYNFIIIILVANSEIKFIKSPDDVKIQGKTITFTKDEKIHTVFIDKIIDSEIVKMFISFSL
jgi:hypothetical protein